MEFKIQYKKNISGGYIGMNHFAAKSTQHYGHKKIPFNHKHPQSVIEIKKGLPKSVRKATIRHEKCEVYLMKNKHYPYRKAHKLALKFEDMGHPFPTENIDSELKKFDILKR